MSAAAGARDVPSFAEAELALQAGFGADHPRLRRAAILLEQGRYERAAQLLRAHLEESPADPVALYLMAESAIREGQTGAAEQLLAKCVNSAPHFAAARLSYAQVLLAAHRSAAAVEQADLLLQQLPKNPVARKLKASALEKAEEYALAVSCWRDLCADYPAFSEGWLHYGYALRLIGQQQEAIAAYRRAIEADPANASAYWELAATKAFRFGDADVEQMENLLRRSDVGATERAKLHFALGQAYGERQDYQKSFANYAKGNALQSLGAKHDPERMTRYVAASKGILTSEFFKERAGFGCQSGEPIFIVGMQRSGSTLVEQILASHSQIEGTKELPELLLTLWEHLETVGTQAEGAFGPAQLARFDTATCRKLGERYLERTQMHRTAGRPFFTDKMPANFAYIGLIRLILPNAKIVDVRRHPMACGFANFTELFSGTNEVAYRLGDIGLAYRNYAELMAHFDAVMPGRVHRIYYERLVAEPETEIRRLLEYLSLPFEQNCLEFHKTERTVTTRSSEQVRQPIYKAAVDRWRNYEPWLGPLKSALGDVLDHYPCV
ncbi:MAG TPA: sulfotransferase [Rhizomicrobium sp.]|nr:sulfotransferase [Rhizomicrobium sp.]